VKEITRDEAEELFLNSEVLDTNVESNDKELCILTTLSDNTSCLVKYDTEDHSKSYFVED